MSLATGLRDITDVPELTSADEAFMRLAAEFFMQHGMSNRFGLVLTHDHAIIDGDFGPDMVLVERPTGDGHALEVTHGSREAALAAGGRPTAWDLSTGEPVATQICVACDGHDGVTTRP